MNDLNQATDELFLREQLLQKEMALELEQIGKSQLIDYLTKDIKKPIEQLIQFSELALLRLDRKQLNQAGSYISEIKMIAEDLKIHLDDLKEASSLRYGDSNFNIGEVDVKNLLKQIQKKFKSISEQSGVKIQYFMSPAGLYAQADEHKLYKVMSIIISFLIEQLKQNDQIKIYTLSSDDKLTITIVNDNGFTTDPEKLNQLYLNLAEDNTKKMIPGFHLGVCQQLMSGQQGDFQISFEQNETRFILTLQESKDF